MAAIDTLKILEIGPLGHFKRTFPGQVRYFSTANWKASQRAGPDLNDYRSLKSLADALATEEFDLIVCMPSPRSPWHWQTLSRTLFNRHVLNDIRRPLRHYGPQLLRFYRKTPVAVVDFEDTSYIDRDNFFLMDRATLYFKRELPADEWRLLTKTASDTQPSGRLRRVAKYRHRLARIRPLPLGLPTDAERDLPDDKPAKQTDIFFAGTVNGMPVRGRALAELQALRDEGFVIDIPDKPVSRKEFYQRCARAWLTLSPEGYGWDCFRHYEAAACGSVPLINPLPLRRHAPLIHGEHAIYYEVEPGLLARRVREALADKATLAAMGEAARAHAREHHTMRAVLTYVLETSMAELGRSAGLPRP